MNPKHRRFCEKCKAVRRYNQRGECIFCNNKKDDKK